MTDFCFLGSDVNLFRCSIRHYMFALKQQMPDDGIDPYLGNKLVDLNELWSSGFRDGGFTFPYCYVDVVLEALRHYDTICCYMMKQDSVWGYFELHQRLVTLIAQINLMLDCNDDD